MITNEALHRPNKPISIAAVEGFLSGSKSVREHSYTDQSLIATNYTLSQKRDRDVE